MGKSKAQKSQKAQQKKVIDASTAPPEDRVQAGLVEKNNESKNGDTTLPDEIFENAEDQLAAQRRAGAVEGGVYEDFTPSSQQNPNVSEEEQGMEMKAAIVGPPSYGSPRPETSAGRLLPLHEHPLRIEALPAGHPAAISGDYGVSNVGLTDLERDSAGGREDREAEGEASDNATDAAKELAAENGVNLADVDGSGEGGRITKTDVQDFIDERDSGDGDND